MCGAGLWGPSPSSASTPSFPTPRLLHCTAQVLWLLYLPGSFPHWFWNVGLRSSSFLGPALGAGLVHGREDPGSGSVEHVTLAHVGALSALEKKKSEHVLNVSSPLLQLNTCPDDPIESPQNPSSNVRVKCTGKTPKSLAPSRALKDWVFPFLSPFFCPGWGLGAGALPLLPVWFCCSVSPTSTWHVTWSSAHPHSLLCLPLLSLLMGQHISTANQPPHRPQGNKTVLTGPFPGSSGRAPELGLSM